MDVALYERNTEVGGNWVFKPGPSHSSVFEPLGCIWPLAEVQGRLVANAIQGEWQRPRDIDAAIRRELAHLDYSYGKTPRHAVEVDYYEFRKRLQRELAGRRAF